MQSRSAGLPPRVLAAFVVIVVLGGSNPVAVRLGMAELPPLWAATMRFGIAAGILAVLALVRRSPRPRDRHLVGAAIYGVLSFGLGYALMYTAMVDVPAGLATIVFAIIPLLTLLLAVAHRLEVLSLRGVAGALIAVVGVAIAYGMGTVVAVPAVSLALMVLSALMTAPPRPR